MNLQSNIYKDIGTDHLYVNLTYVNDNENLSPVPARVSQQFDRSVIQSPQDWNLSIVRFSISSSLAGLVYQPYLTTTANTTFYVGLSYNNVYYDVPIVLPVSTSPDGITQIQTVYNINTFLDIINTAFATAVTLLPGGNPSTGLAPLITFNAATQLYSMNIPAVYGTGTVSTSTATIGVNASYQLYQLFEGWSVTENNPLLNNNHDVSWNRVWRGDNLGTLNYPVPPGTPNNYMILVQEAPWPSSIELFDRLIITATSIPCVIEYRAENFASQTTNSSNQVLNILTDFFVQDDLNLISSGESWIYTPNIYRITSLQGTQPLVQLDINILLSSSTTGQITQLYLAAGKSIDIKLLFLKKGLTS